MNNEESRQIKVLLTKYRDGKCNPEEIQRVEKWLHGMSNNATPDLNNKSEYELLRALRKQVLQNTGLQSSIYITLRPYVRIAAALLLIPLALLLYNNLSKPSAVTEQQFSTLAGEKKVITLPDSTEVVLNASSVLTVSNNFNEKFRNVKLSGEAYFRVAHNKLKPFIVSTGKLKTQVLGTQFNVHAYHNENNIKVAVVQGKVKVSEQQSGHAKQLGGILTHNLMLSYDVKSHSFTTTTADAEKLSSWQNNELYFEDADMQEITMALARHYNRSIQLADKPIGECKYTIDFSHERLPRVLDVLSQLTGITYTTTHNKIIIHSKNCH